MTRKPAGPPARMAYVSENERCHTIFRDTDLRLLEFLDPGKTPKKAMLYSSELLYRTALTHHRRLVRKLVSMAERHGEDVTHHIRDEWETAYPNWKGGKVYCISAPGVLALRRQVEVSIGSVLFHAHNVEELLVRYTMRILDAPNAPVCPNGAPQAAVRGGLLDDLRKAMSKRKEGCGNGKKSDQKEGRANGKKSDRKEMERLLRMKLGLLYLNERGLNGRAKLELGLIEKWRNMRAHDVVFDVTLEGDPWDVRYSTAVNELVEPLKPELRFTGAELDAALKRLEDLETWWTEKMRALLEGWPPYRSSG